MSNVKFFINFLKNINWSKRIHSPTAYEFTNACLYNRKDYYAFDIIEELKEELKKNNASIEFEDLGAGSKVLKTKSRSVKEILKYSVKNKKYGKLFFKSVLYLNAKTIVELGTSLGISTAYFAMADKNAKVVTVEGVKEIAEIAQKNFDKLNLKKVELIVDNFDNCLEKIVEENPSIDILYIDGNHTYEATIKYFNSLFPSLHKDSLVIIDDIYWSEDMHKAWEEIKNNNEVKLTIDLYQLGLVFFKREILQKKHYRLVY